MRMLSAGVAVLLFATMAEADVRLKVKKDGTKLIYNVGRGGSGGGTDYNWLVLAVLTLVGWGVAHIIRKQ